jgi:hypothetical protein
MKVAFAIDFLLERTPEVFLLELLLAGFEDAEIYCLAHAPGQILGRIEHHRIHASPLSRLVKTAAELPARSWMIPSAARGIQVSPDVDKLIIISSGWAQLIKSAPKTERFVWLHEFAPPKLALSGWKKLFAPYQRELKRKALFQEKNVAYASETLAQSLSVSAPRVIRPGHKTDDYFVVPDETHTGEYPYHLVLLKGADSNLVAELTAAAKAEDIPLHFADGQQCSATIAGMTHSARAVWALIPSVFPYEALGALCCGRPAVVLDRPELREVLPQDGAWFLNGSVRETLRQVNRDFLSPDKKSLRRAGLKYNERLFKNQMRSWAGIRPQKTEEE